MFQKTVLDNGIRVVTESHRYANAVSTGLFVETGTRDENAREAGLTHFLEHMVFKGTKHRNAYAIAKELEAVGGDLNAYTTQEYTCFHATTLREHFDLQLDVLCDLVLNATFVARETEMEKQVVVQEIAMTLDQPEEIVFDLFYDELFGEHQLGRPILGTEESVSGFTRKDVKKYYETRYTNKNIVISCAGNIDHEEVVKKIEKHMGKMRRRFSDRKRKRPRFHPLRQIINKDTEQVQIVVGLPCSSFKDDLRFEAFIVNGLLGGGMTSRLYQSVREKRGLAYTIYSQLVTFTDIGTIAIYAGTDVKQARNVLDLIGKGISDLKRKRISEADLRLYKTQIRGGILLGADDVENRMSSLGINEMVFGEYRPVDEVVSEIESVTAKSVKQFVDKYISTESAACMIMGPIDENKWKWPKYFAQS